MMSYRINLDAALAVSKFLLDIHNKYSADVKGNLSSWPGACVERLEQHLRGDTNDLMWDDVPRESMPVAMATAISMVSSVPETSYVLADIIHGETADFPEDDMVINSYREAAHSMMFDQYIVDEDMSHPRVMINVFNTLMEAMTNEPNTPALYEGLIYALTIFYPMIMGVPADAPSGLYGIAVASAVDHEFISKTQFALPLIDDEQAQQYWQDIYRLADTWANLAKVAIR